LWTVTGVSRTDADALIRMRGRASTVEEFRLASADANVTLEAIDALFRAGAFDDVADTRNEGAGSTRPVFVSAVASEQMDMVLPDSVSGETGSTGPSSSRLPSVENDGNLRHGFRVVPSLLEFYPHPRATPVELAGRIRNFRDFKTSSGTTVGFFELFDSSGSVRVFVPWERVAQLGEPLSDGCRVTVKGKVRLRDGRKVCDALEIVVAEGGNGHGETSPDDPSKGDS
jgi:DNA polymerase III alpha subunit